MRDDSLPVPQLDSPRGGAMFTRVPRLVTLKWEPVPGAIGYVIEVKMHGRWVPFSCEVPRMAFNFGAKGEGKWRVWALFPSSRRSPGSEIRSFRYRK